MRELHAQQRVERKLHPSARDQERAKEMAEFSGGGDDRSRKDHKSSASPSSHHHRASSKSHYHRREPDEDDPDDIQHTRHQSNSSDRYDKSHDLDHNSFRPPTLPPS